MIWPFSWRAKTVNTTFKVVQSSSQVSYMCSILGGSHTSYHISITGTWRLKYKIGMPLDEIHLTGEVPYCLSRHPDSVVTVAY